MAEPENQDLPAQDGEIMVDNATGGALRPTSQSAQAGGSDAMPLPAAVRVDNPTSGLYYPTNGTEWLNSTYLHADGPGRLNVQDFGRIKAVNDISDAYWQDPHIKWALEMIKRRHQGLEDVFIVSPNVTSLLYRVGLNPTFVPDRRSLEDGERRKFQSSWAPVVEDLSDRPLVILPINNGFEVGEDRVVTIRTEGLAERDKPQHRQGYNEGQGQGSHWSFVFVDRRDAANPAAYYVDGMVRPIRKRNGRWTVHGIRLNGKVAGKVLRGFDTLLELEEGNFVAATLKFVPHMWNSNASEDDIGACGPHLYAFLDHILSRKTAMIDPGLQATYNDEAFRTARATELGFDSVAIRAKFADELMQERWQQEALQPNNFLNNLTPHVLRDLMTADGLIELVRTTAKSLNPGRNDSNSSDDEAENYGNPPILKSLLKEEIENNPDLYRGLSNLAERYELAHSSLVARQKQHDADQKPNTKTFYLGSDLYRNVPLNDTYLWPEWETNLEYFAGTAKQLPQFTDIGVTPQLVSWVNKIGAIKNQIDRNKDGWEFTARAMLHFRFKRSFLGEPDAHFETTWSRDKAAFDLHDKEVIAMKSLKNEKVRFGKMRLRMMRHYQGNKEVDALLKHLEKYKFRSSPPAPGNNGKGDDDKGDDDNPGDGRDSNGGHHDQPASKDDGGASGPPKDNNAGGNKSNQNNNAGGKRSTQNNKAPNKANEKDTGQDQTNQDGTIADNAIPVDAIPGSVAPANDVPVKPRTGTGKPESLESLNFRTMNADTLLTYITQEMRRDPRVAAVERDGTTVEPSIVSWRALCFVTITKHNFKDESDADRLNLWLQDSIVFDDKDRKFQWVAEGMVHLISDRMNNHYCPDMSQKKDKKDTTDLPEYDDDWFLSEENEDDDLDPKPDSESQGSSTTGSSGTKRKNPGNPTGPTKKLKLSHTEFLKMPDGTLARWTRRMPTTFRNQFPDILEMKDVHRARIWLERMFGEGFESMHHEKPLSDASVRKLRSWLFNSVSMYQKTQVGLTDFLHKRLLADPKIGDRVVPIPDLRARLEEIMREEGEPSNPTDGTGVADPSTGPKTQTSTDGREATGDRASDSFDSQDTVETSTVTVHIGRDAYTLNSDNDTIFVPWDSTGTAWPSGATSLPDFANISISELTRWSTASPEVQRDFDTHNGKAGVETLRAALHMKFKRTFLHEPDSAFSKVWINDSSVFDAASAQSLLTLPTPEARNGEIRRRIMLAYEPEMLTRVEAHPKSRPANPKITIQTGSLENPESFDSGVHGAGPSGVRRSRSASVDRERLVPGVVTAPGRQQGREGLRPKPKPSAKRLGG
ncbi:hypothetical protein OPT61_g4636 [Boeremia exigua]|uniref:Uncharacterized protein n=1 Tax=Boeremia exigua TaxID=749465 RepID=A0ACC2IDD0_9PLEO|nr:hypothetical protein OPT61_g4636 [Boeremia exigua]